MKIFDGHCHIESGFEKYNIEVVGKNVIFNSIDSYHKYKNEVASDDSVTLVFESRSHLDLLQNLIREKKIDAIKIHSRLQKISCKDYPELIEKLESIKHLVPVVIDAFYHGPDIEFQPSLEHIIQIAKRFSSVPVVIAHSGGYRVLEYFMHLKSLSNIYFDLSFSLAYLRHSSAFADFKNLLRNGDENKIIFGTDFPVMDARLQLNMLIEVFNELNIDDSVKEKILFSNAFHIFKG